MRKEDVDKHVPRPSPEDFSAGNGTSSKFRLTGLSLPEDVTTSPKNKNKKTINTRVFFP